MPDRADVEQALAALIAGVLYPDGTTNDPVVGKVCRVYRGWPVSGALEADLAAGAVHVTIQSVAGSYRNTTRYSAEWQGAVPATTLQASVDTETVQFVGVTAAGQAAGVLVDGVTYVYRVQASDAPADVAAAMAVLILVDRPVSASGATITLPYATGLVARVVTDGRGGRELRRQVAGLRITLWCPDPATRDQVASLVDVALADQTFIDVGGWACRMQGAGGHSTDESSDAGVWRRDLTYSVEYPTVAEETLPAMLFGLTSVNGVPFTV